MNETTYRAVNEKEISPGNGILETPSARRSRWVSKEVLGQIHLDKEYFARFLKLSEREQQVVPAAAELRENAAEAMEYIQIREEFWRRQNPIYARKPGLNFNPRVVKI